MSRVLCTSRWPPYPSHRRGQDLGDLRGDGVAAGKHHAVTSEEKRERTKPGVRRGPEPPAHDIGGMREDFGGISRLADQRLLVLATSLRGPHTPEIPDIPRGPEVLEVKEKKLALHPVDESRV